MIEEEELNIKHNSIEYAKKNKKRIAKKLTNINEYAPESKPVSVFMAGSPGAGKTESSKNLVEKFAKNHPTIRIDPDELREYFKDYNGKNSFLFQGAVSILAEKIHDLLLKNNQSFVFDSTLSIFEKARYNILRSLKHARFVQILYVYQDPIQAWNFVRIREEREGRRIPKEEFIRQYFSARNCVNKLKREFGPEIQVDLLVKNIDGSDQYYKENIDIIDNHVPEKYNMDKLNESLQS